MKESYSGVYFLGKFVVTKSKSEEEAANKYLEMVIGDRTEITREDVANAIIAGIRMIKRGRSFSDSAETQPKMDGKAMVEFVREFINSKGYLNAGSDRNDYPRSVPAKKTYEEYREWCYEFGSVAFSQVKFGEAIAMLGFTKRRISQGVIYEVYTNRHDNSLDGLSLKSQVSMFLIQNNYANAAQKLFGDKVKVEEYNASIDEKMVGVREDMGANFIYMEFCEFCITSGIDKCSQPDFSSIMSVLSFKKKKIAIGMVYEVWIDMDKHRELHPDCYGL